MIKKGKHCTIAAILFNWLSSLQFGCSLVLFPLCSLHSFLSLWFWVTLQCSFISAEFSCCGFRCTHTRTLLHFLRHKTMSAGRLFPAACSSVYCMILAVLKENLCSHTYSVTLLLPPLSPPENWISTAVVSCDVPVPDKSLMSLGACINTHTQVCTCIHTVIPSWCGLFKANAIVLLTVANNLAGVSSGV